LFRSRDGNIHPKVIRCKSRPYQGASAGMIINYEARDIKDSRFS
jgi:hypothetical protein